MCGFSGFWFPSGNSDKNRMIADLRNMQASLRHRGPDGSGIWFDDKQGLGLSHNRLSIQDLSKAGNQPMCSQSKRWIIVFNGEIYNHSLIRSDLSRTGYPCKWRGTSDTETILAAIECWGIEKTIEKISGMFSAALWDREKHTLSLIRDRFGEKPLYFSLQSGRLFFGSELKALKSNSHFVAEISRVAALDYFRHGCVKNESSIYASVSKLPPGTYITFCSDDVKFCREVVPHNFWSSKEQYKKATRNRFAGTFPEALNELEVLLTKSVMQQTISDVPLGTFLSGGIDSSLITALLQKYSNYPIPSFTIGFDDAQLDEAPQASKIAQLLGTSHQELYLSEEMAADMAPNLADIFDEPFADSSQLPTYFVSKLAKEHVSVCMSGDGGDELFGGYNRHVWLPKIHKLTQHLPFNLRASVAKLILSLKPSTFDNVLSPVLYFASEGARNHRWGELLHKFAHVFKENEYSNMYRKAITVSHGLEHILSKNFISDFETIENGHNFDCDNFAEQIMFLDLVSYLPDDILVKVDRSAMAVSLETRMPFLSHEIASFAWSLPPEYKIKDKTNKLILRKLLERYLPPELLVPQKKGFGVPLSKWLRSSSFRDWCEHLISEDQLKKHQFLDPHGIQNLWLEHLSERKDHSHKLWNIMMFQSWAEKNV